MRAPYEGSVSRTKGDAASSTSCGVQVGLLVVVIHPLGGLAAACDVSVGSAASRKHLRIERSTCMGGVCDWIDASSAKDCA